MIEIIPDNVMPNKQVSFLCFETGQVIAVAEWTEGFLMPFPIQLPSILANNLS